MKREEGVVNRITSAVSRGASSFVSDHKVTGQNEYLKKTNPNGLWIKLREGRQDTRIRLTRIVERPDGHGYEYDKSESENDVLSENRTEVTTSESGDSQSQDSDNTQLFPFEEDLIERLEVLNSE